MKRLSPLKNQNCLSFGGEDLVIIDKFENLPENSTYYSDYVLLIICMEGRIETTYDGRRLTLHQHDLFFATSGSVLSDYMLSPKFDCKILAIRPSEATASHELQKRLVRTALYIKENPVRQLTDDEIKTFFGYYNFLSERIQKPHHRYSDSEVRAFMNAFLLFVVGTMHPEDASEEPATSFRGDYLVEAFLKMVNDDGGCNRLVEYYAEKLNISAKYLSTLVRSSIDRKPTEIIRLVTMKEIERRLRYSNQSIKEISNALHFPNTSFFGKYFKQHSGMTPNTYRKKYHS